jgi:hypothetical protein
MTARRTGADFDAVREWANGHLRDLVTVYAPGYATKLGANGRGPCPVHGGDGDAFALTDGRGWFCHSTCGRGGDGVDLVRSILGKPDTPAARVEVLRELAPRAGVTVGNGSDRGPYVHRPRTAPPARVTPPPAEDAPDPVADALALLRLEGMVPAEPRDVLAVVLAGTTLGPRGAAFLTGRGFTPHALEAGGFRSLETRGDWDALETLLAESYTPDEREAAHLGTLPANYGPALVLPYVDGGGVHALRLRTLGDAAARYRTLKGATLARPFGWDAVDALPDGAAAELHASEGELNAYALRVCGAVAVGLAGAGTWRAEWTPALVHAVDRGAVAAVVAWYDDDDAGQKGRQKLTGTLAAALGRSWVVAHGKRVTIPKADGRKDANDLHRRGELAPFLERGEWRTA